MELDKSCSICGDYENHVDPHPCFKHSTQLCAVRNPDGKRVWNPSQCVPCIQKTDQSLNGSGKAKEWATIEMKNLLKGVLGIVQRVSTYRLRHTSPYLFS